MAESVLRLRVDSSEYDSKIKRAAAGLTSLEEHVRSLGGTFAYAEQNDIEFVKALGNMETVSRTSKGKLAELGNAIQDLSAHYKRLTAEEKASPYGQALRTSLDQLTDRYKGLKTDIADVSRSMGDAKESTGGLSGALGVNITRLASWGTALAAGKAALEVVKGSVLASELGVDEWGRVVESSHAVYEGFLNALNSGDIRGYLSRIDQIVAAARSAYDALDELGTYNAFTQMSTGKARNEFNAAIVDYKEGNGSKENVMVALENYQKELEGRQEREREAYIAKINELAAQRGIDAEALRVILEGSYEDYAAAKSVMPSGRRIVTDYTGSGQFGAVTASTREEAYAATFSEEMGEALRDLKDAEIQEVQALGAAAYNTGTEIEQLHRQAIRYTGAAATTTATGSAAPAGGKADAATTLPAAMGASYWDIYSQVMPEGGGLKGIGKVVDVPVIMDVEVADDGVVDDLLAKMKEAEEHSANIAARTGDWGDALSTVGSAFDGIGDAIGGTAGEYVSWIGSTISALGELLSTEWAAMILSQGKLQFPLNVVAIASTIGAVTSAISSMPKFATGGIVPGSSFSGDHVPIYANSGELILNRAQQTNLATQLRGTSGSAAHTSVSGEQLVTVINAYGRRTGRGEILK